MAHPLTTMSTDPRRDDVVRFYAHATYVQRNPRYVTDNPQWFRQQDVDAAARILTSRADG